MLNQLIEMLQQLEADATIESTVNQWVLVRDGMLYCIPDGDDDTAEWKLVDDYLCPRRFATKDEAQQFVADNKLDGVDVQSTEDLDGEFSYQDSDMPNLVQEIQALACGELIASNGECNWPNIKALRDAGFNVRKGESDSFGWLSGVIPTRKGLIVYG